MSDRFRHPAPYPPHGWPPGSRVVAGDPRQGPFAVQVPNGPWPPPPLPVPVGNYPEEPIYGEDGERWDLPTQEQQPQTHPGAAGWKNVGTPTLRTVVRPVDLNITEGSTVALWAESGMMLLVEMLVSKQSATYTRHLVVPSWGLALPVSAGAVRLTSTVVQNKAAADISTPIPINGSLSRGWTFEEPYSDQSIQVAGPSGPIVPPMFARTLTIVVIAGSITAIDGVILGTPIPAGQQITMPAGVVFPGPPGAESCAPHTVTTPLVSLSTLGLIWGIVGP